MPTLVLGVIDIPYQSPPAKGRRRRAAGTKTTGDVAEILEAKYHIFEIFYQEHRDDIVGAAINDSLQGAIESVMAGAPLTLDPFGTATSKIEDGLKQFIATAEMEKLGYPGVPTQAALMGVNHRLKLRRGPRRPSFIDTGIFQASIKSWISR